MHNLRLHTRLGPKHKPEIRPDEFLAWAKADLKGSQDRSKANALSNAKRAIHARMDEILLQVRVTSSFDWEDTLGRKRQALKKLGLETGDLVAMLTDARNGLEHRYQLPSLRDVRAHVQIAELWLAHSENFLRPAVAISGIKVHGRMIQWNDTGAKVSARFERGGKVRFFWDRRKLLIRVGPRGGRSEVPYRELTWSELLSLQLADYREARTSYSSVPAAEITRLFKKYERFLAQP